MKAMILAAGKGTRLLPLTRSLPKCLMPVCNYTLLSLAIRKARQLGAEQAVINTHYLADKVHAWLSEQQSGDLEIHISHEPELLGTGGALVKTRERFFEPFWLLNADIVSNCRLEPLQIALAEHQALACLGLINEPRFNSVAVNGLYVQGIKGYGQTKNLNGPFYTYAGLAFISPRLLDYLPEQGPSNLVDAWVAAINNGEKILGLQLTGYWNDLGTWQELWQTQALIMQGKLAKVLPKTIENSVLRSTDVFFDQSAVTEGFVVLGKNVVVENGVYLADSILLDGARIKAGSVIKHSIIGLDFIAQGEYIDGVFA